MLQVSVGSWGLQHHSNLDCDSYEDQVDTKRINEQVRRNPDRFPTRFRFQLTENEKDELVTICDRFEVLKHSSSLPYVFTEQGVAMLSALRSEKALGKRIGTLQKMDLKTQMI